MQRRAHAVEVGHRAEQWIDPAVVRNVVAEILHRRGIERRDPDRIDAELAQIGDAADDPVQVADAIAVGILERARIDLIDRGGLPPELSCRCHLVVAGLERIPATSFEVLGSLRPATGPGAAIENNSRSVTASMINDLWYKNGVIYCLSVGTYMDANGDGIGDFRGLLRRLDYLHGLGITAIWLMPFQPSPMRDDGYDIADYYGVDPRYGTLGDFVQFTHGCRQRGIRVIIDLVVNHTSNEHDWFKSARSSKESPHRNWYVWADRKPTGANKGIVFPGVQKSTWTHDKEAGAWYFHRFYDFQPDLNTSNPMVQAEILRIMGFWIQLGVSGFRMDAVPFVIATKGAKVKKPVEQYDMLRAFREFLQWREGDAIILAEANVLPNTDMEYFGRDGDRMHMMFNFQVNQYLFYALASADVRPLAKALMATRPRPASAQWGLFLRNHDELDLGRLTSTQRNAVFKVFAPDKNMQLYDRGIRRRLAPMLGGNRRHLELAYSLMFTLPGTPVIRYGDEISMGDDLRLPERNCARTPMQWSTEPHGGFTNANKPAVPVIN